MISESIVIVDHIIVMSRKVTVK